MPTFRKHIDFITPHAERSLLGSVICRSPFEGLYVVLSPTCVLHIFIF